MTTPSTGDARAVSNLPDEVVEAVGQAVFVEMDNRGLLKSVGDDLLDEVSEAVARAAIEAYQKAMREGGVMDEALANTAERWGVELNQDDYSREDKARILAISIGLGALFGEVKQAERDWMHRQNAVFKSTPITMVKAGHADQVLVAVNRMRNIF